MLHTINGTAQRYAADSSTGRGMLSSAEWLSAAAVANGKFNRHSNGPSTSGESPGATSAQQQNRWALNRPLSRSGASHLTMAQLRAADKFTTLAFHQLTAVDGAAAEEQYDDAASVRTSSEQVHM
jgi:hypothetical protein